MSIQLFEAQCGALPQGDKASSLYLLVDPAQDPRLPQAIVQAAPGMQSRCLLTNADGPDLEKAAPHLVAMPPFDARNAFWQAVFDNGAGNPPCQTLIASPLGFDALHAHLRGFIEVLMPDDDEMILAFWDPAILGTLVGQEDDATLHVRAQLLTASQREHFLAGSTGWWYWARGGDLHRIRPAAHPSIRVALPLKLEQTQVDGLIEASVPDHLLSFLQNEHLQLLAKLRPAEQYDFVKHHLLEVRKLGATDMRDLIAYLCAALIYGDEMTRVPRNLELLMKVKMKEITLNEAISRLETA